MRLSEITFKLQTSPPTSAAIEKKAPPTEAAVTSFVETEQRPKPFVYRKNPFADLLPRSAVKSPNPTSSRYQVAAAGSDLDKEPAGVSSGLLFIWHISIQMRRNESCLDQARRAQMQPCIGKTLCWIAQAWPHPCKIKAYSPWLLMKGLQSSDPAAMLNIKLELTWPCRSIWWGQCEAQP